MNYLVWGWDILEKEKPQEDFMKLCKLNILLFVSEILFIKNLSLC